MVQQIEAAGIVHFQLTGEALAALGWHIKVKEARGEREPSPTKPLKEFLREKSEK